MVQPEGGRHVMALGEFFKEGMPQPNYKEVA